MLAPSTPMSVQEVYSYYMQGAALEPNRRMDDAIRMLRAERVGGGVLSGGCNAITDGRSHPCFGALGASLCSWPTPAMFAGEGFEHPLVEGLPCEVVFSHDGEVVTLLTEPLRCML